MVMDDLFVGSKSGRSFVTTLFFLRLKKLFIEPTNPRFIPLNCALC